MKTTRIINLIKKVVSFIFGQVKVQINKNNGITNWVKAKCDPTKIPTLLLEMGLQDGNVSRNDIVTEINRQAKTFASSFIQGDAEIQNFLKLLKSAPVKKDGQVAKGGKCYINLSHFILSEELKNELLDKFNRIEKDGRRLSALIMSVQETFPDLWNYCPGGTKQSLPMYLSDNDRYAKFSILMDPEKVYFREDPNRDSTGAYTEFYFSMFTVQCKFISEKYRCPLADFRKKFAEENNISFSYKNDAEPSLEVYVAYGNEAGILYKNLYSSIALINKSSEVGYKQRVLDKFCHGRFSEIKENAETLAFIEKLLKEFSDPKELLNYDMDVDTGVIAYIDGRSEWGNSGGTAQFSQVVVSLNGQEAMKEFQYRDRFSGSNDKYANDFISVRIIEVKKDGGFLNVKIEAIPGKRYSSTTINLLLKDENSKLRQRLNLEEQKEFSTYFMAIKTDKMSDATKFHGNQTGTCMAKDYSGDASYPSPCISAEELKPEIGIGAFVTKECIDAMLTSLEWRFTLYLVKNQKVEKVYEDHGYEESGDASIFGLEIFGDKLKYSIKSGRKEYQLT